MGMIELIYLQLTELMNGSACIWYYRITSDKRNCSPLHCRYYTPGIYAEGYIVFVFPFVRSYVRSFDRSYFRPVRGITAKFYVQATRVEYISPTTHQKAFIFGP